MSSWEAIERRFWAKVQKAGPDECWLWTAAHHEFGYGILNDTKTGEGNYRAHRLSYELHFGPIPEGLCVLHRCDVPACVNPKHLFLGTRGDNYWDSIAKGRRKEFFINRPPPPTHCWRGHDLRDAYIRPDGKGRNCRECGRERALRYYRSRR